MTVDSGAQAGAAVSFLPNVQAHLSGRDARVWPEGDWIHVAGGAEQPPEQGWKIHVSATRDSAEAVLAAVVPLLLARGVDFKLAAGPGVVERLNDGFEAPTQVGKFISVYPRDAEAAVELARALDDATAGLPPAPAVPSDLPLRPGSPVHYRYGAFATVPFQLPTGEVVPALTAPDGSLVPDLRSPLGAVPPWMADPFAAAGLVERRDGARVVGRRFLLTAELRRSFRGSVHFAADLVGGSDCVVKHARPGVLLGVAASAYSSLQNEATMLELLEGTGCFPRPLALVEEDDGLYLAMEHIDGRSLQDLLDEAAGCGRGLPAGQAVGIARAVAAALGQAHGAGFVFRDVKADNVLLEEDGGIRLIDPELAAPIGEPAEVAGTRGYASAQQLRGEPSDVRDDVFSLGALLHYMVSAAPPPLAPAPLDLLRRPLNLLVPGVDRRLNAVIAQCIAAPRTPRYADMKAVGAALEALEPVEAEVPYGQARRDRGGPPSEHHRALAKRLGDTLAGLGPASGEPGDPGDHLRLPSYRDVNIGTAGIVVALAELAEEIGDRAHRDALELQAAALVRSQPLPGGPLPGLYVGEAGLGAALLRAGQVLGRPDLIDAAAAKSKLVAGLEPGGGDLFIGMAGQVRFHLLMWQETGERRELKRARAGAEMLCAAALDTDTLGMGHGLAGIAKVLLEVWDATGEDRFHGAATGAAGRLRDAASAGEGGALDWPVSTAGGRSGPFWCHGAAGVGRFFLHAARAEIAGSLDMAEGAARAAARGGRWASPIVCHGLAGNIDFLIDVHRYTGDERHLHEAWSLAHLLETFAFEDEGRQLWLSEEPGRVIPGLIGGLAGIALCLLRLGSPGRLGPLFEPRAQARSAAKA